MLPYFFLIKIKYSIVFVFVMFMLISSHNFKSVVINLTRIGLNKITNVAILKGLQNVWEKTCMCNLNFKYNRKVKEKNKYICIYLFSKLLSPTFNHKTLDTMSMSSEHLFFSLIGNESRISGFFSFPNIETFSALST